MWRHLARRSGRRQGRAAQGAQRAPCGIGIRYRPAANGVKMPNLRMDARIVQGYTAKQI
jgi:hypothetical protein